MSLARLLFFSMTVLLFLPAFSGSASGCKGKKHKQEVGTTEAYNAANSALSAEALQKKTLGNFKNKYKSLYAHIEGATEGERTESLSFSGNIYWVKDSLIWLSMRKFGFEGLRVKITPDSCIVLNRLNKTVMIREAGWIEAQFGVADGFAMLQAMLLNEPRYLPKAEKTAGIQDSMHQLTQKDGHRVLRYLFSEGDYRLRRVEMSELRRQMTVSCNYLTWAEQGATAFSSRLREMVYFSPEQGSTQVRLEFDEVEFNKPQPAKFEIPDHYERI